MNTYIFLQHYWWFVVSLLGALLVFLLFVQGGNSLLFCLGKTEEQKKMMINSTGRKWEFTFTTLVTFGGAFFASFPLFYSTSFGGAYWLWMIILFSFVLQAVSYEFQSKAGNLLGKTTYRTFLVINGVVGPVLLGGAVATFFTGSEFYINKGNMADTVMPVISQWANAGHGLDALLNPWNVVLGLAVFFLARILGALYFINNINEDDLVRRCRRALWGNTALFLVFFLAFVIRTLVADGYAVRPETGEVFMEPYKYLTNFLQMPVVLFVFLIGVVAVLWGIIRTLWKPTFDKGIWFAGAGTVLAVLALLLVAGYNNTAYYPSTHSVRAMVEDDNFAQTWYVFWVLPMVFILLNLFMVPRYQITLQTGRVLQVYIVMSIALLFLMFMFNAIFLLMANSLNRNARLQQENQFLSMQQQRYESLKAAIEEARQARHDMRHQLNQISALAEAGDLDNLKAYLAKTVSRIPDLDMNFCENRAADSVVGYYCALAKREGVPFCAKLDLPQVLPVDEIDLCLVLSNLLENAFEASLRTAPARRKIAITAYVHAERLLLVEVENAFDGEVNEKSGLFRSSKRKENGIGIQSVQHIAEKTGGASTFTHQNGVFSAKVMLCGEKQPPETADSTTELYGKCGK